MKTQAPILIRRANERGHSNHGWLESWHTFSFGDYYNPKSMGFRSLRVINEDHVSAGGGFPLHPHHDMEIFSYVLSGQLAHEDSIGNRRILKPGEIQLMRAGTGVRHSEFNPSATEKAHFLQVWITPETTGLAPAYTEWLPDPAKPHQGMIPVITRDGREGSAMIARDADIFLVKLPAGSTAEHRLRPGRGMWLQIAKGTAGLAGATLAAGDAAAIEEPATVRISALDEPLEAILFDLA